MFITEEIFEQIRMILPGKVIYLVGGAVRDQLMGREIHDLDFVLPEGALNAGRRVADALGGAYYPLDEDRETARVIFFPRDGAKIVLDFSLMRGSDLESDLRARDFTINAMAVDLAAMDHLIDPLNGAEDLRQQHLRACSDVSFEDDPLRILRGVRQATAYRFHLTSDTKKWMREAVNGLGRVSPERIRDELFRILDGPNPELSIAVLEMMGALPWVLPELAALRGVRQSPPHANDVWYHTLDALRNLSMILNALSVQFDAGTGSNLYVGLLSLRLGRYRNQLEAHFQAALNPDRSVMPLLFLAALYHDAGKPATRSVDSTGRIRFWGHDTVGADLAARRAEMLRLSNPEVERLKLIVRHHMRPLLLAQDGPPSSRAIYRFFKQTGGAGVDICLLSLADVWATYGAGLPQTVWENHLDVVRALLEAWWEHPDEQISPPALLNGNELMTHLNIAPGPLVGQLLEAIREGQVVGEVSTREDAFELAARLAAAIPDTGKNGKMRHDQG